MLGLVGLKMCRDIFIDFVFLLYWKLYLVTVMEVSRLVLLILVLSWSRAGNLGLGLGPSLVLSRSQSRSKQSVETTKISTIFIWNMNVIKMAKCWSSKTFLCAVITIDNISSLALSIQTHYTGSKACITYWYFVTFGFLGNLYCDESTISPGLSVLPLLCSS